MRPSPPLRVVIALVLIGGCSSASSPSTVDSGADAGTCSHGGRTYALGEKFAANDACNTCVCNAGGAVVCTRCACLDTGPDVGADGADGADAVDASDAARCGS